MELLGVLAELLISVLGLIAVGLFAARRWRRP